MIKNILCPACSSRRLSPETGTRHAGVSWVGEAVFQAVDWVENMFGKRKEKRVKIHVNFSRVRICGDCGHVLLFVEGDELAALNKQWEKLEPFDTSSGLKAG